MYSKANNNSGNIFLKEISNQEFFKSKATYGQESQKLQNVENRKEKRNISLNMSLNKRNQTSKVSGVINQKILRQEKYLEKEVSVNSKQTLKHGTSQFQLLPIPPLKTVSKEIVKRETLSKQPTKKVIQSDCLISGRVDFILNMYKLYPNIASFFEVYGNLVRLSKGKYPGEYILILKSATGPVLQGIYYAFEENDLSNIEIGSFLSCTGKFLNLNKKFNIYKININIEHPVEETFSRMQNVCSFALNNINKKLKE